MLYYLINQEENVTIYTHLHCDLLRSLYIPYLVVNKVNLNSMIIDNYEKMYLECTLFDIKYLIH